MSFVFRSDIQGLRAVAVFLVIMFHYDEALLPAGFIGVDIFFVISGFLITQVLMKIKQAPFEIKNVLYFYLSRFKRIVPAYFFLLIVVGIIAAILFIEPDYGIFSRSLESSFLFDSNRYFSGYGSYFAPGVNEQPLLHTWSLAIEMQFYFTYPLLVLLLPIKYLKHIVLCITVSLITYYQSVMSEGVVVYYDFLARVPAFFLGALPVLYAAKLNETLKEFLAVIGILLLIISVVYINKDVLYPGYYSVLPALAAMFIIMSSGAALNKWLSNSMLAWFGALSYSLYLWHWPVIAFFNYVLGEEWRGVVGTASFVLITIIMSIFSYYIVENRYRNKNPSLGSTETRNNKIKTVSLFFISLLVFVAYCQTIDTVNQKLSPPELPVEYKRYADPDFICHGKIVGNCFKGDLSGKTKVLVLGDSHAAMLNDAFDNIGKKNGVRFEVITGSSCLTISGFDYKRLPGWAQLACAEQIVIAEHKIDDYEYIILAGMWSYHSKQLDLGFLIDKFLTNNSMKKIIMLGQIPELMKNASKQMRLQFLGISGGHGFSDEFSLANDKILEITSKYANVKYLNLSEASLFDDAPVYLEEIIYFDESHLNQIGAKHYGDILSHPIISLLSSKSIWTKRF